MKNEGSPLLFSLLFMMAVTSALFWVSCESWPKTTMISERDETYVITGVKPPKWMRISLRREHDGKVFEEVSVTKFFNREIKIPLVGQKITITTRTFERAGGTWDELINVEEALIKLVEKGQQ